MSPISFLAVEETERISKYMQAYFHHRLHGTSDMPTFPAHPRRVELYIECNQAVNVLVQAFQNKRSVSWSVVDYVNQLGPGCKGRNEKVEEKLLEEFPAPPAKYQTAPMIATDLQGNILLWYLPNILTASRTANIWNALKFLKPSIKILPNSKNWRVSPEFYRSQEGWTKPGNISMAPAWFQQGHEKSNPMEVSAPLMKSYCRDWLGAMEDAFVLIGGILSIMHPDLFKSGCDALRHMQQEFENIHKGSNLLDILKLWGVPFSVISAICNRDTPLHRDTGSSHSWFDILLPLGHYHKGKIQFPGLGLQMRYDPGSIVGHLGRVLRHGVNCEGDRACLAFYMRENVIENLNPEVSQQWMNVSSYVS